MTMETAPSGAEGSYASQLDALRSVAKWLLAAFAGVGGLLVAGLSISGIGRLPLASWRFYAAAASAALAVSSVGFMIREVSVVLTHEWLTLASFGDEPTATALYGNKPSWRAIQLREIDEKLTVSRHELFGYAAESRSQLQARLRRADEALWRARAGSRRARIRERQAEVLRRAARDTVQYANYHYTLKLFARMRKRIAWAALMTAVSVGVFAYAVNPLAEVSKQESKPRSASIRGYDGQPLVTGVIFTIKVPAWRSRFLHSS